MHLIRIGALVCAVGSVLVASVGTASSVSNSAVAFSDLSFADANARAAKEEKFVFIDFYTTWCAPCKRLDAETWTSADVGALVNKHAIALKLDAEKEGRELAQKYGVQAYPTLLLLKSDGSEQDRMIGFRPPGEFATEFAAAVAGENGLKRAQQAADAAAAATMKERVDARFKLAREFEQRGKHDEALAEYLWLYDEGMKAVPAMGAVRLSFLTGAMGQLAARHAPTAAAMKERRDDAKRRFESSPDDMDAPMEFVALAEALGDREVALAAYSGLAATDPRRRMLGGRAYSGLVAQKRYAEALAARPAAMMTLYLDRVAIPPPALPPEMRAIVAKETAKLAARDLEVLAGTGNVSEAREFQAKILAIDASVETQTVLKEALARAGRPELWSEVRAPSDAVKP